jgi:hypothetical protein
MYGADTRQLSCGLGFGGCCMISVGCPSWLGFGGENWTWRDLPPHFAAGGVGQGLQQAAAVPTPSLNMTFVLH